MKAHDVAVVGCGLMGAALARTFAKAGQPVAAWNRTPEKAEALAGDGVTPVRSINQAVRSSRLVIACTTTYETTQEALAPVEGWDEVTLVNVGTGTPDAAQEMARWASDRGASYLDGMLIALPDQIGTDEGLILISGPSEVWAAHEVLLTTLGGGVRYVSDQVSAAKVLGVIGGSFYTSAIGAYVEAVTYAQSQGVPASALREVSLSILDSLGYATEEAAAAIEGGSHGTEQATLSVYAEGMREFLATMREAGQQAQILAATLSNLELAEAAGLGELGIYAQTKVIAVRQPYDSSVR